MSDGIFGLIVPGMALMFAAAAFGFWWHDRSDRYMIGYVIAPLAIGSSLTIDHFATVQGSPIVRICEHALTMLSCMAIGWAANERIGRPAPIKAWLAICTIAMVANFFSIYKDAFIASLFILNSVCAIIFVTATQSLAHAPTKSIVDRVLVCVFALAAAQYVLRPAAVVMLVEPPFSAETYRNSVGHDLLIATASLLMLALSSAILATVLSDKFRKMQDRSSRDTMTGLLVRRAFEATVMKILDDNGDRRQALAMIVADIDHFKSVNDTFGHQAGDDAIAAFGALISDTVRDTDTCGRVGGEEFCILVWNCDADQALGLAERLRRAFGEMELAPLGKDVRLTASFGVAQWREGEGYGKLFARADKSLYEAKKSGRNRVCGEPTVAPIVQIANGQTPRQLRKTAASL